MGNVVLPRGCLQGIPVHYGLLELGAKRLAIESGALEVHAVNLARVADIVQGVGVQHDKIGPFPLGKCAGILDAQHFGGP